MDDTGAMGQMLQAAHLYYIENRTQSEIAAMLGVSRPTVSRLLTRAREEGIVQVTIRPWQVRDEALEARCCETFGLRGAIIVRSAGQTDSATARNLIGYAAAPYVATLIQAGDTVGIGRGRTLAELAAAWQSPQQPLRNLRIVQLLGDVGFVHAETRSHELARVLASRLGGEAYYLTAPALVESPAVREALMASEAIRTVVEMYKQVRVALVGVGAVADSPLVLGGLVSQEQARQLRQDGIVGDICGHFFDQDGKLRPTVFSDRAIGIGWEELRSRELAICVAGGPEKVLPLLGALRGQIINFLVTDQATATEIVKWQTGE